MHVLPCVRGFYQAGENLLSSDPTTIALAGPNQRGGDIVDWQGPGLGELLSTVFQRDPAWLRLADPAPIVQVSCFGVHSGPATSMPPPPPVGALLTLQCRRRLTWCLVRSATWST